MPPDAQTFKSVLSRFASGVTVVTTRQGERRHGLTVSAFSSVSAAPPRVLVCLNNESDSQPLIERSGVFAVHILGQQHVELGTRFAKVGATPVDLFEGLHARTEVTGSPILSECLAWLDCRVETALLVGSHTVFVGAVQAAGLGADGEPVLYYARAFRALDPDPVT
jgi:flavin reductase (DIM6/NTAB) family NADH-FMN oxidoreductase RutF